MIGISTVTTAIKTLLDTKLRAPAAVIPAIIMICSLAKRPGLSCSLSTAAVLDSLSKVGFPTDPLPDGSPNLMNQVIHKTICEVYRAIKEDANIQVAVAPGEIMFQGVGANASGPVTVTGSNLNAPKGCALIQ